MDGLYSHALPAAEDPYPVGPITKQLTRVVSKDSSRPVGFTGVRPLCTQCDRRTIYESYDGNDKDNFLLTCPRGHEEWYTCTLKKWYTDLEEKVLVLRDPPGRGGSVNTRVTPYTGNKANVNIRYKSISDMAKSPIRKGSIYVGLDLSPKGVAICLLEDTEKFKIFYDARTQKKDRNIGTPKNIQPIPMSADADIVKVVVEMIGKHTRLFEHITITYEESLPNTAVSSQEQRRFSEDIVQSLHRVLPWIKIVNVNNRLVKTTWRRLWTGMRKSSMKRSRHSLRIIHTSEDQKKIAGMRNLHTNWPIILSG
jgi:hypothetical protein